MPENYGFRFFLYKNIFDLLGWNITIAGLNPTIPPCPFSSNTFQIPSLEVDILIDEITDVSIYDCIHVESSSWRYGGDSCQELIEEDYVLNLLKGQMQKGRRQVRAKVEC